MIIRLSRLSCRLFAVAVSLVPASLTAQNINLKTVAIPSGEQFLLFPSVTLGMGSIAVALDDSLAAPFSNPARRLTSGQLVVYATPTLYGEANGAVGGRSLPVSALLAGERLHGAFAVATQSVNDGPLRRVPLTNDAPGPVDDSRANTYLFGSLGRRIGARTSVGASAFLADLGTVDGVDLLYARSTGILQDGRLLELRAGFSHDLGADRRIEGTVTNTRLDMTHHVHYATLLNCDLTRPPWQQPGCAKPEVRRWDELNEDHTVTWGSTLRYRTPLDAVTRAGVIVAVSTKDHPKIPTYVIANDMVSIPRDPGNSTAFNIGAGLVHADGKLTAGLELILEPARSHTWAFADSLTVLPSGATLRPGDKTVDNEFDFMNWVIASGLERRGERFGFQLGLRFRAISYELDQQNFLAERTIYTRQGWVEWSPSWGAVLDLGALELRYTGRLTAKGFFDLGWFGDEETVDPATGTDFLVGATGASSMPDYRVTMHRLTLSMPLKGR